MSTQATMRLSLFSGVAALGVDRADLRLHAGRPGRTAGLTALVGVILNREGVI